MKLFFAETDVVIKENLAAGSLDTSIKEYHEVAVCPVNRRIRLIVKRERLPFAGLGSLHGWDLYCLNLVALNLEIDRGIGLW